MTEYDQLILYSFPHVETIESQELANNTGTAFEKIQVYGTVQ